MCGIHRTKFRSWIRRMSWMGGCANSGGMRTTAVVWVLVGIREIIVVVSYQLSVLSSKTVSMWHAKRTSETPQTNSLRYRSSLSNVRFYRKTGAVENRTYQLLLETPKQNRSISSNRHAPTTTVNVDRLTRDVGGIVAEKEGNSGCNLFGSTAAFHNARNDGCLL